MRPTHHPNHAKRTWARARRGCLVAAVWIGVLLSAAQLRGQGSAIAPNPLEGVGIEQRLNHAIPLELHFRDHQGRDVTLESLQRGRPVVLSLIYYECPMLCRSATDGLIRSLRALSLEPGTDFDLWTVSIDPNEEPNLAAAARRTTLRRYGRSGAEHGWEFLTGEADAIAALAEAVGFRYRYDPQTGQYAHAAGLMILTPDGRVSRYLLGVEYSARDLRLSLVEASEGRIGSLADHVLLLCYQYNPAVGKYGLLIHRTLQLAGILTVVCVGSAVGAMLWYEKRKGPSIRGPNAAAAASLSGAADAFESSQPHAMPQRPNSQNL